MSLSKRFILLLLLFSIKFIAFAQSSYTTENLVFDGLNRQYKIYIPSTYDGLSQYPLIFTFHGGAGTFDDSIAMNDFSALAENENFIAVYPQAAVDPADGSNSWIHKAPTSHDDIYFIEAIIDALSNQLSIDTNRVYACGYSEGGIFSYELACRLNNKIAAISSVSGSMLTDSFRNSYYNLGFCSPVHPTAVLLIQGTADFSPHSTYNGFQPYYMSVQETATYWAAYNNCNLEASVSDVPNTNTSDGSVVERYSWTTAAGCLYVEELKVIGGGHDWPGSFGNMDINSTQEIWNFVSNYDLSGIISCNGLSTSDYNATNPNIVFYPNPTRNELTVESSFQTPQNFKIFNIRGQEVLSGILEVTPTKIDVSGLSQSVYILKISNNFFRLIIE
jgi:polyhydroxybutyrate depolymerase